MIIEKFLFKTKNINRSEYIWNAIAGIINALQSVILLMVITRTNGLNDAGIFSIAWAIASLLVAFGQYSMRSFQVSDAKCSFELKEYIGSRFITVSLMLLFSVVYILISHYDKYKGAIVFITCLWKMIEAAEDVFLAAFQQNGRLDIAAKSVSLRYIFGMITCSTVLIITQDLILSLLICVAVSLISFVICTKKAMGYLQLSFECRFNRRVLTLLKECAPLCISGVLIIYISNAPKYAIDAYLTEEIQAYYNFIFMPVFSIGLVTSFLYQPLIASLGKLWNDKNIKAIQHIMTKQIVVILVITVLFVCVGYFIGIPVLSLLYSTDLSKYVIEFCILLLGGGMLGLSHFLILIITVIRKQRYLLYGYCVVTIIAIICTPLFVKNYEIVGASVVYTVLMTVMAGVFAVIVKINLKRSVVS